MARHPELGTALPIHDDVSQKKYDSPSFNCQMTNLTYTIFQKLGLVFKSKKKCMFY